jgi:DNA-binding HxlR family transcriptional regulator
MMTRKTEDYLRKKNRILQLLERKPSTFTQLIKDAGFSRRTVHRCLQDLESEKLITRFVRREKTVRQYKSNKLGEVVKRTVMESKVFIKLTPQASNPKFRLILDLQTMAILPIDEQIAKLEALLDKKTIDVLLEACEILEDEYLFVLKISNFTIDERREAVNKMRGFDVATLTCLLVIYDLEKNFTSKVHSEKATPIYNLVKERGMVETFDKLFGVVDYLTVSIAGVFTINRLSAALWALKNYYISQFKDDYYKLITKGGEKG